MRIQAPGWMTCQIKTKWTFFKPPALKDAYAVSKKSEVQISLQGSISIALAMSLMTGQIQTTGSFFSLLVPNDAQTASQWPKFSVLMTHHMCQTSYRLNDRSPTNKRTFFNPLALNDAYTGAERARCELPHNMAYVLGNNSRFCTTLFGFCPFHHEPH